MILWENFRECDHTIDLIGVFRHEIRTRPLRANAATKAEDFLHSVLFLCPIKSRQAAAVAIAQAIAIWEDA